MTPPQVSVRHRLLDLLAALLVIAGGVVFGIAFAGLERMRRAPLAEYTPGMAIDRLAEYNGLVALSWLGVTAVVAGVGTGVHAWVRHRRATRAADSLSPLLTPAPRDPG